jgi:hypothetical protein
LIMTMFPKLAWSYPMIVTRSFCARSMRQGCGAKGPQAHARRAT